MKGPPPRLRLLVLTPFPPRLDATHGGAKAMAHLISMLGERQDVALLTLRADDELPVDEAIRDSCVHVSEVRRATNGGSVAHRVRRAIRLGSAPMRRRPVWAEAFDVPAFHEEVGRFTASWQPDVVQIEFHVMGQYLRDVRSARVPIVLVEHEPGEPAAEERLRAAPFYRRWWHRLERSAWEQFETAVLQAADAVVVFTEADAEVVARMAPSVLVRRIPIAVPIVARSNDGEPDDATLLFVANFGHAPNQDAARRLISTIVPGVRAHVPNARLVLIGQNGRSEWKRLQTSGIEYLEHVPDLTPHFARAAVLVAPLHTGGGMRVKTLEALAAGKPLVATPLAVRGLDVKDGRDVVLAGDDREFVARIVQLLNDRAERDRLSCNARSWAEANVDLQQSASKYERLYGELVGGGG